MNSMKLKLVGNSMLLMMALGLSLYSFFDSMKHRDFTGIFCLIPCFALFIILMEFMKEIKNDKENEDYIIAEWDDTEGNR